MFTVDRKITFHIRNVPPNDLIVVLKTLSVHPELQTIKEIVSQAQALGFQVQDSKRLEALITARELGLISNNRNMLSDVGAQVLDINENKPDLFVDVIHSLLYSLWSPSKPEDNCYSWSYRTICNILWDANHYEIIPTRIASETGAAIQEKFKLVDIPFSAKSVRDALLWLIPLNPSTFPSSTTNFQRRVFCPPEIMVLAINFLYKSTETDYGVHMLLNDDKRDEICKFCLLDVDAFERVLGYTINQFEYLEKGLGGGWGRYIVLHRAPLFQDFL
jgi:hypothetical protein